MTWASFMGYVLMTEMGTSDAIARNYDLSNLNGSKPGQVLDRCALRLGLDQPNIARPLLLPMIAQMMRNVGYRPPEPEQLQVLLREWYNWDRIRKGELQYWPKRVIANPLLD